MGYEVNKGVGKRSRQHGAEVAWNGGDVIMLTTIWVVGPLGRKLEFVFVLAAAIIQV